MSENRSASYAQTLQRGRITLLAIIVFIAFTESGVAVATIHWFGWQAFWRLSFLALLTLVLLRAMYRGSWVAQRAVILGLGIAFVLLLVFAFSGTVLPAWARLVAAWLAGSYGGMAIVLARSRPIREFMTRGMLRQLAMENLFNPDGERLFYGKKREEWLAMAQSNVTADRKKAVEGLKSILQDIEDAECERALLALARETEHDIRYDAVSAIRYSKLIRHERALAIEVMQAIRSEPLPDGAEVIMTAEDPDTVHEYFEHDQERETAVAEKVHIFENAGATLEQLGVDPDPVLSERS